MSSSMDVITQFLFHLVVYSIPLLYGTCGEIVVERSGSLDLGVEGTMAIGAIFGYLAGCSANSLLVGVLVAYIAGTLVGEVFALFTVTFQANQNVTGLTITTFGVALYFFMGNAMGEKWPVLTKADRMVKALDTIDIPLLSDIPVVGKAFFSHNILVYIGVLMAILLWFYFEKTRAGMRVRAVGENPAAADSLGINVAAKKYQHIMLGSGIMGIGGLYMGLNLGGTFEGSNCWINGYGWIAIALVIFANWSTARAILGTFVFGFFRTLAVYYGTLAKTFPKVLGWLDNIPSQFFSALPFIVTLVILIMDSVRKNKHSNEPAAIGVNYYREDR